MKKLYFILLVLAPLSIAAQIPTRFLNTPEITKKGIFETKQVEAKKELKVDLTQVLKEDEEEKGMGMPYRFGKAVDVNYTLANSGEWHTTEGARIWKLQITSRKALSLNLIFKRLFIPENGELFIYNEERTVMYGPVTHKDMTRSGKFSTDLIPGQSIILELFEPIASKGESILEVRKVIHGYKLALFGDGLSCHDDVNCSQGNAWRDQSDGVAMILLADNTRTCSGSLLNNGCQDFTPNILSAFHCADIGTHGVDPCIQDDFQNGELSTQETNQVEDWVFRFQYKSPTCNGGEPSSSIYYTFLESRLRANDFSSDAILVEMDRRPMGNVNTRIKYLGWDRRNIASTAGAMIGHPVGDVMKISTYNSSAQTNNTPIVFGTICPLVQVVYPPQSLWRVNIVTGASEGGFSGGPLFNQNGRVIGQLTGSGGGCAPLTAWNGRLDASWDRLSPWLTNDPNVEVTNILRAPYFFQENALVVCNTTRTYSLADAPSAATHTVTWSTTSNLTIVSSNHSTVSVRYSGSGNGIGAITASIRNVNTNLCPATAIFSKDVQAGRFTERQITVQGTAPVCRDTEYVYTARLPFGHQPGYTYQWVYPSNWMFVSQNANTIRLLTPSLTQPAGGPLEVRVNNGCGWSDYTGFTAYPVPCGGFSAKASSEKELFNQYPNPTARTLTVAQTNEAINVGAYFIELYNNYGEKVTTISTSDRQVDLNTADLPEGHYVLKIIYKEGILTRKIIVEKE